jgi:hypothetical protein
MGDIHFLAVGISTVVGFFLLGGLWYSKKGLGLAWGRANGLLDEQGNLIGGKPGEARKHPHPGKVFAVAFTLAIAQAILFGLTLPAHYELKDALIRGVVVGAGFVGLSFGINYQFADRKPVLWLIDGGYHALQFTIYGLVFGLLR